MSARLASVVAACALRKVCNVGRFITTGVLAILLMTPALATAQLNAEVDGEQAPAVAPRPVRAVQPRVRAYFLFDSTALAAERTFDAVIGKTRVTAPGAGGEVFIWQGLFARVALSSLKETGSRVVVFDDQAIALGIPLTIEMRPLELAAGWRARPMASGRIVPYGGVGLLRMGYRETSEFATGSENTDTTFSGRVLFGGIEAVLGGWLIAGAEVQHRAVPDALGDGGVSQAFGERDLGGVTFRVLVGIRR